MSEHLGDEAFFPLRMIRNRKQAEGKVNLTEGAQSARVELCPKGPLRSNSPTANSSRAITSVNNSMY